jgi:predicted negative regulator of RcsB-dependent stress response
MPQTFIVIFLLFFAVLAFGWFYWQRAKSRSTTEAAVATEPAASAEQPASTAPTETTDSTPAS